MSANMSAKRAERLQVMLTIDEVRRVEEWRFENRMPSRSAAVRALMNLGLRADAAMNEAALLEGAVSSRDVGVVENDSVLAAAERPAVLVVAADLLAGQGIGRLLEQAGFRVLGPAGGAEEAGALAGGARLAAVVLDAGATGGSSAGPAGRLAGRDIPVVVIGEEAEVPSGQRAAAVLSRASAPERLGPTLAGLIR